MTAPRSHATLYIPHALKMKYRLECALLRQITLQNRVYPGTFPASLDWLRMCRRIDESSVHRRARWVMVARLRKGPLIRFQWHPRRDPFESPENLFSRAGNVMFNNSGMYFTTRNGRARPISKLRLFSVRLDLPCPKKDCDGDVRNKKDGTLVCDTCGG
jgi:hypothetical protein